jgi:hypothetical protein
VECATGLGDEFQPSVKVSTGYRAHRMHVMYSDRPPNGFPDQMYMARDIGDLSKARIRSLESGSSGTSCFERFRQSGDTETRIYVIAEFRPPGNSGKTLTKIEAIDDISPNGHSGKAVTRMDAIADILTPWQQLQNVTSIDATADFSATWHQWQIRGCCNCTTTFPAFSPALYFKRSGCSMEVAAARESYLSLVHDGENTVHISRVHRENHATMQIHRTYLYTKCAQSPTKYRK